MKITYWNNDTDTQVTVNVTVADINRFEKELKKSVATQHDFEFTNEKRGYILFSPAARDMSVVSEYVSLLLDGAMGIASIR
jgi:hypothetical protein